MSFLLKHPRMRPTQTGTLDVSVTESGTNGAGVSETTSPSATLQKPSNKSRTGYTPPQSNASCRSQRSHAKLRGYVLEKLTPSSQETLTSCESITGSTSRPPPGTATTKLQVAADLGRNRTRAELPAQPNRTRANAGRPSQDGNSAAAAAGGREIIPHRDSGGGGSDGGSSNHGANRRAGGGGDRGGRGHANSHASGASQGGYDARQKIEELRREKSATVGNNDGFPAFFPRLRNLLLPDKFKPLGITEYDAKQDPIQWLRCYALSIENASGNNDTKCLYFPFCLDQAPLTWLESLDKHSIDMWDQLKEQFTSNFVDAMGRSSTRMDLAMVKQEQGETLRKYMRCFFDKRATVVDVTDKEVIDLVQDGLYHRRTFEDFGRRRPRSITHLKDMITS
jgi:hypothetical protein